MTDDVVRGLVLAGGRSSRMGRDKTDLVFSGRTLLARAVDVLQQAGVAAHVSGRDPAGLDCDSPWLPDDRPGLGPLGGILTGLRRLGGPLLVLACDLPLMRPELLRRLLAARRTRPDQAAATMFAAPDTGLPEPLVAVYETEAMALLERAMAQGVYKLTQAVPAERRLEIFYGPEQAPAFLNLNTPGDVAALEAETGRAAKALP